MGEQLSPVVDASTESLGAVPSDDSVATGYPASDARPRSIRRLLPVAAIIVTVAVVASVVTIAWTDRAAYDAATAEASAARTSAIDSVNDYRAAMALSMSRIVDATSAVERSGSQVLDQAAYLGGADALASLSSARADLAELVASTPEAEPIVAPAPLDLETSTESLTARAAELQALVVRADRARSQLDMRNAALAESTETVRAALQAVAEGVPVLVAALLAERAQATEQTRTAAADAAAAVEAVAPDASSAELSVQLGAYAAAASAVVASHDAESARIAAEKATQEAAAAAARRSSGGGGGGGGGGNAVLSATNAHRAAGGVAALSWNGTLASRSCSFAATLAAADGGLWHSGDSSGFRAWAENVAYGYGSASAVVTGWMNSAGHHANIMNPGYTMMGSCSATSPSGTLYWVQQFGA